ncbi:MAG: HAD family hydrolase [Deltaproteobacteria bacterium]|nr:HAD family hydrolase [Deltaproteobacteria bacterium]
MKRRLGEGHPGARNRLLYFKQREEQGGPAAPQAVLEVMERYERALEQEFRQQWRTLERAALLERLTAHGPAAIVSDENTRTQLLKLRALDPQARFFRWIVTSEEVGAEKATGRPFEEALGRIGCAASECVMVGDSVESDLAPALRLGMRAVLTREFIGPKGAVPEGVAIIDRLDDLPQVLAR